MARSRRRNRYKNIAIVIEMDQPYPHHLGCYEGIMRYAAGKPDWRTTLDPLLVGAVGKSGIRQYDGIVGRIGKQSAKAARAAGIPAVNHWVNSPASYLPSVFPADRQGCREAAEHFLARGFRQFGYVGPQRDRSNRLYLEGFEPPLSERGLTIEKFSSPRRCEANTQVFVRFYHGLRQWLAGLPTPLALLTPEGVTALYIIQICRELGLRVPHDVGIVVCRENLTVSLQAKPTLTCIEQDDEQVGYRAAELLDQIMLGHVKAPTEPIWIEPKALRVRGSSDAFVSKDPLVSQAMRFITENSHRAIKVEQVAEAADTSKQTLQQRFARHVGRSVYSEIERLRIERVKRLLVDSETQLEEVALDNGFTDVSHLVKNFRKVTGITPGEFRRKHHG